MQSLLVSDEIDPRQARTHRGGKPRKYLLDEPGRRLLLARYDGRSETITELAQRFHVPRWVVKRWGSDLGLTRQKDPLWTEKEEEYLTTHLHRQSIATIAQRLGRTQTAVKLKAKRLGVRKTSEGHTMRGLCLGLGCDHHKVERWIAAGWLKGIRRQSERTSAQGGDLWFFTDTALRQFVREHPIEVDPRRVEWVWLVDVLTH